MLDGDTDWEMCEEWKDGNDQPTDTLKVKVKKHLAGCFAEISLQQFKMVLRGCLHA